MKRCFRLEIILPMIALGIIGLIMIWSVAPDLFFRQLIFWLLGFLILFTATLVDWRRLYPFRWPFYLIINLLLAMPLVFGGIIRGSSRWLVVAGVNLQPSEIAKPLTVLFWAFFSEGFFSADFFSIISLFFLGLLPSLLIFSQPDLASGLIISFSLITVVLTITLARKAKIWPFLLIILGVLLIFPLAWKNFLRPYQKERIIYFLNPKLDPLGKGYHLIQAEIAIGSGKFLGNGFRKGSQSQLAFLPEKHTDFIFAAIAEELGYFGVLFLSGFYVFFFINLLRLIFSAKNNFSFIFAIAIFSQIFFQTVVNIGMNMGVFPIAGVTLPFISYGGSSLISLMLGLGMIFSTTCH